MTTRTYTPDQPYQRYAMVSGDIKLNPTGSHIITPNMGWQKVPDSRWLWLLDGMFYIEGDRSLTPAYATRSTTTVQISINVANIRAELNSIRTMLDRIETALPKA